MNTWAFGPICRRLEPVREEFPEARGIELSALRVKVDGV